MKSVVSKSALPLVCLCLMPLPSWAQSQAAIANPPPPRTAEDLEWETIRLDAYQSSEADVQAPADDAGRKAKAAQRAGNLLTKANRARDFHQKNSQHAKSSEAKKLEAVLLLNALHQGESSIEGRVRKTIDDIRKDKSLPESMRSEVVGTARFMGAVRKNLKGAELFAEYEAIARSLILEFPGQPQGYESLYAIARDSEEAHGKALAQEILNMTAPEPVKRNAALLLARYQMVGKKLDGILEDAGDATAIQAFRKNRPTLIYTWATWSPGSIKLGQDLAKRGLGGINVLAVNLDEDVAAAQALAASSGLPGILLYDPRGQGGALAKGLKLNGAPQVYFVDAEGIVRDVRGSDLFQEKLTNLGL
jgi:hypothetical protein